MFDFEVMNFVPINEESTFAESCVECNYPGDEGCNCNTETQPD